jgi:hypothetical protein
MARTPKPPYLKGLDAQAKAALSPRLKELPPPPPNLSTAERLVWLSKL